MKQIKLAMGKPFRNYVEISIIDVTDGKERRRGGLTADYGPLDLKSLIDQGATLEEAVKNYDEWIDYVLRRYLLDYCEIVEGREEFLKIVEDHIKEYFEK